MLKRILPKWSHGILAGPRARSMVSSLERKLKETLESQDPRNEHSSEPVRDFCHTYQSSTNDEKHKLFSVLVQDFDVDRGQIRRAAETYMGNTGTPSHGASRLEEKLRSTLTPRYMELFRKIGKLEGGVKFLVDFRADLLDRLLDQKGSGATELRAMSNQLKELLSIWFSVGLMKVERITWDSPCQILQKISEYEAVHPVRNWTDLKRRVGAYRRCYIFCHTSMPNEPIVVLHTALMGHIADSIKDIVKHQRSNEMLEPASSMPSLTTNMEALEDEGQIKAAIFYSISSTQKGLQGIELGKHLIKCAVKHIQAEHPKLSTFSTLSPIPGFREWLLTSLVQAIRGHRVCPLTRAELEGITGEGDSDRALTRLHEIIKSNSWVKDDSLTEKLRKPLKKLCATYLLHEKHRGLALNGVANFHLKNGAVLWRINFLADLSPRGVNNSCSLMVNYRYFLDQIDSDSLQYCSNGRINASEEVLALDPNPES